ncbi:uncharacterized protein C10orf120 homolog [Peromyscus maniculatus bairdii]|uniref:uncharacterized protein C10orf120 homolog n=1 Tax=Peromyscus maniculatus bairdii TaxID=230844 RepID=UPI00042AC385|nr:uncharacterized protein C10orf120 homolog [Peromyscus maniculatus bairdii]
MIKEWENRFQRYRSQRAAHLTAQEGTTAEEEPDNRKPSKVPSVSSPLVAQDFPYRKEDFCIASPLGIWTAFYKSDPRIALGKYSPMEQEILHLGGVHTIATRRYLADQQRKEWRMLRKLQAQSSDYKMAKKYRKESSSPCTVCGPPEKIWTAKVVIPAEEFKMPHREVIDIDKHIKRMQLARALRNKQLSPYLERLRSATLLSGAEPGTTGTVKSREEGGNFDRDSSDKASQEEKGEVEFKPTNPREITMNVIFKSEEPKGCLVCHRNDRKTFLPVKKQERCITGLTNRNLFPITGFPGDLMLMNQDFISRGIHPSDAIKIYWLPEEDTRKALKHRAARCPY